MFVIQGGIRMTLSKATLSLIESGKKILTTMPNYAESLKQKADFANASVEINVLGEKNVTV